MLSRSHVVAALESKQDAFAHFEQRQGRERELYDKALAWLAGQSREALERCLAPYNRPGARPTVERAAGCWPIHPFGANWANHQEARSWAMGVLRGVPTLAVDGSQITPSRDFSIPVGAVQVGWFANPHDDAGRYVKNLRFEVLPPEDLDEETDGQGEGAFPDLQVNLRRFELECDVLTEYMEQWAGRKPTGVCFFDGSLAISFAAQMGQTLRRRYLAAVRRLLDLSEEARVPLVGYVDGSHARDLVMMLYRLFRDDLGDEAPRLSDAALLSPHMAWGQRSEAFLCARDDHLFDAPHEALDYYDRVHLVYLKTTATNPPARLDLPAWLLDDGLLDWVVDVVRAECIVGTGYPYAVETADSVAVITAQDRQHFYRLFQEFTATLGLPLRFARKAQSKQGRR